MSIRSRLTALALLFVTAVLLNILALLYLAQSASNSLAVIEQVRQRQLVAVQMNAHLRDAEAAVYRYQIEGDAGFALQFNAQMNNLVSDVEQYRQLADDPQSRDWTISLALSQVQAQAIGEQLIALHDQQSRDLQSLLNAQTEYTDLLLNRMQTARAGDTAYHAAINGTYEASRAMLAAVTAYLAAPADAARRKFTDAVVALRQQTTPLTTLLKHNEQEQSWLTQIFDRAAQLQQLGSRLISKRDLQESLFANFVATVFSTGQQTLVDKVQPHEAQQLTEAQQSWQSAVNTAIQISVLLPLLITLVAGWMLYRMARQMSANISSLSHGADRVAGGNYAEAVHVTGHDELAHLASAFNDMVTELASREERLRTLMGRMAQIQDEERRLIGLDLHDGLTQLVISANMHLNTLNALAVPRLEPQALQELDVSRSLIKQAIDEARKVIAELRPTVVDDFGLEEGLRRYVSEVSEAQHWNYEVVATTTDLVIAPAVRTAIFRIAQEALSNISKHARSQQVRVELTADEQSLCLRVQDWGRGFELAETADELSHIGLVSMQERAAMMGGVCRIDSKLGEGTLVEVHIPLVALIERNEHVQS